MKTSTPEGRDRSAMGKHMHTHTQTKDSVRSLLYCYCIKVASLFCLFLQVECGQHNYNVFRGTDFVLAQTVFKMELIFFFL